MFFILKYVPELDTASHLHVLCKNIKRRSPIKGFAGSSWETYFNKKNIKASPFVYFIFVQFARLNVA